MKGDDMTNDERLTRAHWERWKRDRDDDPNDRSTKENTTMNEQSNENEQAYSGAVCCSTAACDPTDDGSDAVVVDEHGERTVDGVTATVDEPVGVTVHLTGDFTPVVLEAVVRARRRPISAAEYRSQRLGIEIFDPHDSRGWKVEPNEVEFSMVGWSGTEYAWRLTDGWRLPSDATVPAGIYHKIALNHTQPILSPTLPFEGIEHFRVLQGGTTVDVVELTAGPGITFAEAEELNTVVAPVPEPVPAPPPPRRRSRALSNASRLGYVIGTNDGQEVDVSTKWSWYAWTLPYQLLVGRIACEFKSRYGEKLEVKIYDPNGKVMVSTFANEAFDDKVLPAQDYLLVWRMTHSCGVAAGTMRAANVGYLDDQPPIFDDLVRAAADRIAARDEFVYREAAVTRTVGLPRFELKW
jgi:hypothetical protein